MSFSVLHLYDKADFRKVGLSTCIQRRCGSGLCRWMMHHSPLSTFFTLFPKQWHLIGAALSSLARPLSAGLQLPRCPHLMRLSRRIEHRQVSKPDSSFTFPLNMLNFLDQRCYFFYLFFLNSPAQLLQDVRCCTITSSKTMLIINLAQIRDDHSHTHVDFPLKPSLVFGIDA